MNESSEESSSNWLYFAVGLALALVGIALFLYFRQRMFTRTRPIILSG